MSRRTDIVEVNDDAPFELHSEAGRVAIVMTELPGMDNLMVEVIGHAQLEKLQRNVIGSSIAVAQFGDAWFKKSFDSLTITASTRDKYGREFEIDLTLQGEELTALEWAIKEALSV